MTTRAKFKCQGVTKRVAWGQNAGFVYEAEFTAVTGDSPENKEFWQSSPNGSIKLSTVRSDHFEPGQDYYVDFSSLAPAATPA